MTEQLNPCPFCGSNIINVRVRKTALVECDDCKALVIHSDRAEAVAAWNRRSDSEGAAPSPSEAAVAAPVEKMAVALQAVVDDIGEWIGGRKDNGDIVVLRDLAREALAAAPSAPVVQASLTDEEILALWEAQDWFNNSQRENVFMFARSLLTAQTKTPHGLPSDLPINQGVRATDSGEVK